MDAGKDTPRIQVDKYLRTSVQVAEVCSGAQHGAAKALLTAAQIRSEEVEQTKLTDPKLSDRFVEDVKYWIGYKAALKFMTDLPRAAENLKEHAKELSDGDE